MKMMTTTSQSLLFNPTQPRQTRPLHRTLAQHCGKMGGAQANDSQRNMERRPSTSLKHPTLRLALLQWSIGQASRGSSGHPGPFHHAEQRSWLATVQATRAGDTPVKAATERPVWVAALVTLMVLPRLPFMHLSRVLTTCLDASVTQSALEEALASHMNRGAGSRFSISQAFRSRYTPSSNQ